MDDAGNDLAEFYLFPSELGSGEPFYRYKNTQNGGYLFVGEEESAAILANPDLSNVFTSEGGAFESLI